MQEYLIPMNLQLHAEDGEGTAEPSNTEAGNEVNTEETETGAKQFNQEEVNKIVQGRVDRATKDLQGKLDNLQMQLETKDLTPAQKKSYDEEQKDLKLKEAEATILHYQLTNVATKKLADKGYIATDELLKVVIGTDEDSTLEAVDTVTSLIEKMVNEKVKENAREGTPVSGGGLDKAKGGFSIAKFANENRKTK